VHSPGQGYPEPVEVAGCVIVLVVSARPPLYNPGHLWARIVFRTFRGCTRLAPCAYRCTGPAGSADGDLSLEGSTGEAASGGGTRIWVGRIADSFYIDLSLLAIITAR
jgi:hypothetical protein